MEKDYIFNGCKIGDKFVTRGGDVVTIIDKVCNCYIFEFDDTYKDYTIDVGSDGLRWLHDYYEENEDDVVARYKEKE